MGMGDNDKGIDEKTKRGIKMSRVDKIKAEIEALPHEEYVRLRQWFSEEDWQKWDRQIEVDSESGKLDFLIKEALEEKTRGELQEL